MTVRPSGREEGAEANNWTTSATRGAERKKFGCLLRREWDSKVERKVRDNIMTRQITGS